MRAWGCAQLLSIQSVVFSVCRHASRVSRSTAARRRGLVTLAAAESDAAPVAEQAAVPAAKRSLASIQPNEVVEGRVVSAGAVPAALDSDHGQLLLQKPTLSFLALQTSIQAFGAFVDIGAEAQGLIHVSQLAVSGAPVTAAAAAASAAAGDGWPSRQPEQCKPAFTCPSIVTNSVSAAVGTQCQHTAQPASTAASLLPHALCACIVSALFTAAAGRVCQERC